MVDDIKIFEEIPKDERDSFVAYNTMKNLYLEMDSEPYNQYFILRDWQKKHSGDLRAKYMRHIQQEMLNGYRWWGLNINYIVV